MPVEATAARRASQCYRLTLARSGAGRTSMGRLSLAAAAAVWVIGVGAPGYAATAAQQDKMKTCNAEAGIKKLSGDARKSFMSQCLSGGGAMPAAAGKAGT